MERESTDWRKSTYNGGNGGSCVEVGTAEASVVVRDTANREGAVLTFPAGAWRSLLAEIRSS